MNLEKQIPSFHGEWRWLSNMYKTKVVYSGKTFPSSEHAYVWAKMENSTTPSKMSYFEFIALEPRKTKSFGRNLELNPYWDEIKEAVMRTVVFNKFFNNEEIAKKLLATGDEIIQEGNNWDDTFFGIIIYGENNVPVGDNRLGLILMDVRRHLREVKNQQAKAV